MENSEIKVIALAASGQDRRLLSEVASDQGWQMNFADTRHEARELLNRQGSPIVLCACEMPGGDWRETIKTVTSSPVSPYTILVSRAADEYLWNDFIQLGGFDILTTPLREADVLRAIRLGWSYWSSSMSSSTLLAKP
jgi:CheY-like chemotaxis protein